MVEPARKVLVASGKTLEVIDVLHERRQHRVGPRSCPLDGHRHRRRQGNAIGCRPILEGRQGVTEFDLGGPQSEESVDERTELPGLHESLAGKAHQSGQAVRRNPHDTVGRFERGLGSRRHRRFVGGSDRDRWHLVAGWRGGQGQRSRRGETVRNLRKESRGRDLCRGQRDEFLGERMHPSQGCDEGHRPSWPGAIRQQRIVGPADRREEVDACQENVGVLGTDLDLAPAGSNETVLEGMGHLDGGLDPDDAGGPLQRVCGAHHRLDGLGRLVEAFDGQDPRRQHGGLCVGLEPKQFEHGKAAQIFRHG